MAIPAGIVYDQNAMVYFYFMTEEEENHTQNEDETENKL